MRAGSRNLAWSSRLLVLVAGACTPTDEPVPTTDADSTSTSELASTSDPSTVDVTGDSTTAPAADTDSTSTSTSTSSTTDAGSTTTTADPECGNGIVEDGEACDDAGESATCNDDCTAAGCGDGIANATAGESCDDGGESAACDVDCTVATCGDATLNAAAGESCDDGGESAACDVDCTVATCGDGRFNASAGELCDTGGPTALCDGDCSPVSCGDGIVNAAAGEACDDAGESTTCNVNCSAAACGDGITNPSAGESCDDMGPSVACDVDCSPASCGDGLTNATAGELCDAGGASAACDDDCTPAQCGDSTLNTLAGEVCDGAVLGGATCALPGGVVGLLGCTPECIYDLAVCVPPPGPPTLTLGFSAIKQFDFAWAAVPDADHYQLEESATPGDPFVPVGEAIVGTSASLTMPLHLRHQASHRLLACNVVGCTSSAPVAVMSSLAEAVGYVKASNTGIADAFGSSVALSADGRTLAVGAVGEDSNATGIDSDPANNLASGAGAVHVFVRDELGGWSQQAYVKASNTDAGDGFGGSVSLSADGRTLAVGARNEDGNATGIDGDQADDSALDAGAVYVFVRDELGQWSQQAYVKASNTGSDDSFGARVALSGDGDTLAVSAYYESSSATGIDGDQADDSAPEAGAVYVFDRDGTGAWSQQAYLKASNTGSTDLFGWSLALSSDGSTLAAGAVQEDSNATGVDGDQANALASNAGAAYVFVRDGLGAWSQQAYVKASNTGSGDWFGMSVALSGSGDTLAVGAFLEDSNATGVDGDQANGSASSSGAVYVLVRDGVGAWSQQAYVKASNTGASDQLGASVALSGDGDVLAIGARWEDGNTSGIGGDQADDAASNAGAAYVLVRDALGTWSQRAYVKASNPGASDAFGGDLALSASGDVLAIGANQEDGSATGIGGAPTDAAAGSGAVYLY